MSIDALPSDAGHEGGSEFPISRRRALLGVAMIAPLAAPAAGYALMPLFVLLGMQLAVRSRGITGPALLTAVVYLAGRVAGLLLPSEWWLFGQALAPPRLDGRLLMAFSEAVMIFGTLFCLEDFVRARRRASSSTP
jgi:hypothetical protein